MTTRRAGDEAVAGSRLRQALRFERQMRVHARNLTGSEADAADLVQDTFEVALRRWHRLKPGRDVRLWLLEVMSGVHAGRQRAAAPPRSFERLPVGALVGSEPAPVPRWQLYSMEDVSEAVKALPPPLAQVYRMKMIRHLPTDTVVERLHISRPTVAAQLLRAMSQIRATLLGGKTGKRELIAGNALR
jgi:RNA polymerase sigma factor (sigma-70 family)